MDIVLNLLPHLFNGVSLGLLFALIALGFMLIVGVMEVINLAHGSLFALGAYAAIFLLGLKLPFAAACLLAWRTDASLFKHFTFATDKQLEVRIEAVNLFNHVNLGNPDSEVGVPGNPNANAGRINSTAYGNADPQRNFQFAVKFRF